MRPELLNIIWLLHTGETEQATEALRDLLALPENSDAIIANAQNNYSDDDIVVNNDALVTQNSEGDYWVEAWCFVRNTANVEIP